MASGSGTNKPTFHSDVQTEKEVNLLYEDLLAEHKACQKQIRSKDEALKIFQQQLKECNMEKQLLKQEIKQLHSQLARVQRTGDVTHSLSLSPCATPQQKSSDKFPPSFDKERGSYILELEQAQDKIAELIRQNELLEGEKRDLINERGLVIEKCTDLEHCLQDERQQKPLSQSAVESVIDENKQLRLELVEVQVERDKLLNRIERYKRAVEKRKAREAAADKEVNNLSPSLKKHDYVRRISELETIANSLSESVKEKSIALSHQKSANKLLATKVSELEHRLHVAALSGLELGTDKTQTVDGKLLPVEPSVPSVNNQQLVISVNES